MTRRFELEMNIVALDHQVVDRMADPGLEEVMRRAIHVDRVRVVPSMDVRQSWHLQADVHIGALPVSVGFDASCRLDDAEWEMGNFCAAPGQYLEARGPLRLRSLERFELPFSEGTQSADIILRANPSAAEGDPAIETIWDGEIVIENVLIEWPVLQKAP